MRHLVFLFGFLLALSTSAAPLKPQRTIKLTANVTASEYVLPNGLTVYLLPNKRAPISSIYHWVKAGALHEKPGITGIAHLFEHMMFRPLKKGEKGFFDILREMGGEGNANTRYASTVYTTSVPHQHLTRALELESNRFKKLSVDDDLLNVERKAVWSEYSTKMDSNPVIDLWMAIYQTAFPGHPFGWTIVGDRADLEKIKAADCNAFFRKYYVPDNVGLFIAGDFDAAKIIADVERLYGDWAKGAPSALPAPYKIPGTTARGQGKLPATMRNLMFGYRIPYHDGKNHDLLDVTNHIFFGSQLSLAARRFVHAKKLASGADEFNNDYDSGLMKGFVQLLPTTKVDQAIAEIPELVTDLEKLPENEFKAFVREYQTNKREAVLRNEELNQLAALSWGKWGSIDALANLVNKPLKITKKEVVAFAKATMTPGNLVIVTNKDVQ